MSETANELRGIIFSEGKKNFVYRLDDKEIKYASSMGWPEKITPELLRKTPFNIWKWLAGIVVATFFIGVAATETGAYSSVKSFFTGSESSSQDTASNPNEPMDDSNHVNH